MMRARARTAPETRGAFDATVAHRALHLDDRPGEAFGEGAVETYRLKRQPSTVEAQSSCC
jgi:hypothetical protein